MAQSSQGPFAEQYFLLQLPDFGCKLFRAPQRMFTYAFVALQRFRSKSVNFVTKYCSAKGPKH